MGGRGRGAARRPRRRRLRRWRGRRGRGRGAVCGSSAAAARCRRGVWRFGGAAETLRRPRRDQGGGGHVCGPRAVARLWRRGAGARYLRAVLRGARRRTCAAFSKCPGAASPRRALSRKRVCGRRAPPRKWHTASRTPRVQTEPHIHIYSFRILPLQVTDRSVNSRADRFAPGDCGQLRRSSVDSDEVQHYSPKSSQLLFI